MNLFYEIHNMKRDLNCIEIIAACNEQLINNWLQPRRNENMTPNLQNQHHRNDLRNIKEL